MKANSSQVGKRSSSKAAKPQSPKDAEIRAMVEKFASVWDNLVKQDTAHYQLILEFLNAVRRHPKGLPLFRAQFPLLDDEACGAMLRTGQPTAAQWKLMGRTITGAPCPSNAPATKKGGAR